MRIRKRRVLFPLLPVTHSDPNLVSRSPVMVQLNDATTTSLQPSCTRGSPASPSPLLDLSQPSDQPLPPIGKPNNSSDESSVGTQYLRHQHKKQEESLVKEDEMRKEEEKGGQKGNDIRKRSISCSETPAETFSSPSSPKQEERWCEEDKAFPPKKRRGNFENATEDNNNDDTDKKSSKPKVKRMKTKMKRNCLRRHGNNEEEEEEKEATREPKPEANVVKKRVRGGVLMEGSRCSRVNGRGWRCCQQTLVGYSLCEHHLGKGRLRSMTSVRNKSIGTSSGATKNNNNNMPKSEPEKQITTKSSIGVTEEYPLGNDAENSDEKKPVMVTKRRMKLGMVKARSISSLLGQTNTEVVAVVEDNNDIK